MHCIIILIAFLYVIHSSVLARSITHSTSSGLVVRESNLTLPQATDDTRIISLPDSQLILLLEARPQIQVDASALEAVIITADQWVARKISIHTEMGEAPLIFDYGTGDRPHTRLVIFSHPDKLLRWGDLKSIIDGLWSVLLDEGESQYLYFEAYNRVTDAETRRNKEGWGSFVVTGGPSVNPSAGPSSRKSISNSTFPNAISTSNRELQLPSGNTTSPISEAQTSTIVYEIPSSDMRLELQSLTYPPKRLSPPLLKAVLLVAAVNLGEVCDHFEADTPSSDPEYAFNIGEGVDVWFLKTFRPPLGYLTNGQMRLIIVGLLHYMVFGERPEAVRFKVFRGDANVFLGRGEVGDHFDADDVSGLVIDT